jgi:WhiB family redox-sensing transcriptional regulator
VASRLTGRDRLEAINSKASKEFHPVKGLATGPRRASRRRHGSTGSIAARHLNPLGRYATADLPCQLNDPDLWFADSPADLEQAKALCAGCPARHACLIGALNRNEPTGVWGGHIFDHGEMVTYKRSRGRPAKGATAPERYLA